MSESEFICCPLCRHEYEAFHDDLATYQCPKCEIFSRKVDYKKAIEALAEKYKKKPQEEVGEDKPSG
jgi:folate-dependent tRNA-U54 methylase TrmFO/GidA